MVHMPGELIQERFRIVELVGQGGMGAVYRALDSQTERVVAIKQMREDTTAGLGLDKMKSRFDQEWQTLHQLDHPRIPKMLDSLSDTDSIYYVMEFIEGISLGQRVRDLKKQGQRFPEVLALEYTLQILEVVEYLHNLKPPLLHRDIKPENLIIRQDTGELVLVDFGLARDLSSSFGQNTKTQVGTLGFAALEQVKGKPEKRSDLYSVGATLWYLLCGEIPAPFDIQPIIDFRPDLFPETAEIVTRACHNSIDRRYASAEKMAQSIRRVQCALTGTPLPGFEDEQIIVEEVPYIDPSLRPMSSTRFLFYAATASLICFGGIWGGASLLKVLQARADKGIQPSPSVETVENPSWANGRQQPMGTKSSDGYRLVESKGGTFQKPGPDLVSAYQDWPGKGWQLVGSIGNIKTDGQMQSGPEQLCGLGFQRAGLVRFKGAHLRLMRESGPASFRLLLANSRDNRRVGIESQYGEGRYLQAFDLDGQFSEVVSLPKDPYQFNLSINLQFLDPKYTLNCEGAPQGIEANGTALEFDSIQVSIRPANQNQQIRVADFSLVVEGP